QGRPDRLHASDRARARSVRHPRELDRAGFPALQSRIRGAVARDGRSGTARPGRVDRAAPSGSAGGHREGRTLLRLRRFRVDHGTDHQRRRRPLDAGLERREGLTMLTRARIEWGHGHGPSARCGMAHGDGAALARGPRTYRLWASLVAAVEMESTL